MGNLTHGCGYPIFMRRSALLLLVLVLVAAFSPPALAEEFCFGFLLAKANRVVLPEAEAAEIQRGHIDFLRRMGESGKLLAAGPLEGSETIRGIVIYRCANLEEAAGLTEQDPAVQRGRLHAVFQIWRGPNRLGEPLADAAQRDPAAKPAMVKLPFLLLRRTEKGQRDPSLKTMRKEQDFLAKLHRRRQLRMDGAFLGKPNHPYEGAEPGALLVFDAMPLKDAIGIAKDHPLVEKGYATIDALEWMVADSAIPHP